MSKPQHSFNAHLSGTDKLREQLINEITRFERQLANLKGADQPVDFSLIQTYKELIHARKELLDRLPRSF